MSGFKRMIVSINPEEVRNLIRMPSIKIRKKQAEKDSSLNVSAPAPAAKRQALEEQKTRQVNFDDLLLGFTQQLQEVESRNQNAVRSCRHQLENHMVKTRQELLEATQETIIDRAGQMMDHFEIERQHLQAQIVENQNSLTVLMQNRERNLDGVTQWLQAAGDLFHFIRDHFPLHPSTEQQLHQLGDGLFLAAQNQADGMPEAALVSAQQVFRDLSAMRMQLEQIESERFVKLQQAAALAEWLNEAAMEHRFCTAIDLQGNELDFTIDVDFWSKRKLSRLIEKSHRLMEYLLYEQPLEIERLDEILADTLPSMKEELEQVLYQARFAAISSQLRLNIADVAVQALESQGFSLKNASYAQKDMRKGYQAHLQNIEGSAMEIDILPLAGETVENDIQVKSFDAELRTEHELLQRTQEIYRALGHYGLNVGIIENLAETTPRKAGRAVENNSALLLKKPLAARCMG